MGFTTMVGPRASIERVRRQWLGLVGLRGLVVDWAAPPRILDPTPEAGDRIAVASIRHRPGRSREVTELLTAALSRRGISDVSIGEGYLLEPASDGYLLEPASTPMRGMVRVEGSAWQLAWQEDTLEAASAFAACPIPDGALGQQFYRAPKNPRVSIALLDSGDDGAPERLDFDNRPETVSDRVGHGTSMGALIRLAARRVGRDVEVISYRIFDTDSGYARSDYATRALYVALARHHDVVVLALRRVIDQDHTVEWARHDELMTKALQNPGSVWHSPVFVCAGGNKKGQPTVVPAALPGVVVVRADDWTGEAAEYNCDELEGAVVVRRLGANREEPLGWLQATGEQAAVPCFGTSYATALVAGTLV